MRWDILLPSDFKTFTERGQMYLSLLIDKENFAGYWQVVGRVAKVIAKVIAVGLPCVVVFWLVLKRLYAGCNTRHNRDTVPLRIFKRVSGVTYQPLKRTILSFSRLFAGTRRHQDFLDRFMGLSSELLRASSLRSLLSIFILRSRLMRSTFMCRSVNCSSICRCCFVIFRGGAYLLSAGFCFAVGERELRSIVCGILKRETAGSSTKCPSCRCPVVLWERKRRR